MMNPYLMNRKVSIICDTHFGAKKGSQILHDTFEKFYTETFFPYLDEHHIDTVIHLGDCFDVRKGIDYWSLDWAKRVFFNPLKERGITLHLIVGNHDIFYRNTLQINSARLNLNEYDNIVIYDEPGIAYIKNERVFMVPWLCEDNAKRFTSELAYIELDEDTHMCMGHLELAGFYANKDYMSQHGMDARVFSFFDRVFSGHYHKRSSSGNINYLGNPYQMYWNDEGETRGFHIFDFDEDKLEFIPNPNKLFHKVYLNQDKKLPNPKEFSGSYVKVIVENSTPEDTSKFVHSLYENDVLDVKVIETFDTSIDEDVEIEGEDTLTTLTNYVNEMDDTINKSSVIGIFKSLYVEAQEV